MKSHLLIGAATSGSGKTTFTLGLLQALRNRGKTVQPFKCGPDYIDTQHHRIAAGQDSVNLDRFMMSDEHIRQLYDTYSASSDISITEGVMGLFDGYDKEKGSAADIATLLQLPVVLLVSAKSVAYSVAPLIYGFKHFNPQLNLVGVVFNFVASENHYKMLKEAAEDAGIESLGYLPRNKELEIPGRHLGLTLDSSFSHSLVAEKAAFCIEQHIDIDRLLSLTAVNAPMSVSLIKQNPSYPKNLRIAIAHDDAFNFTYTANLEWLAQHGEIIHFSPLHDKAIPRADFVYLPGGYPELYLEELSANQSMLRSLHTYCSEGGKLLAECGGMMYLCKAIINDKGISFPMVNVLPYTATMESMKLTLGYRRLSYGLSEIKGHEFHYSHLIETDAIQNTVASIYNAKGQPVNTALFRMKNVIAGYTHLYWADNNRNQWFTDFLSQ